MSSVLISSVDKTVRGIRRQMKSRSYRAANELRKAALDVLEGQRSGRVYKKPGTHGKTPSKATRKLKKEYGHKLRGGQLYKASAPGEPPARRLGDLRKHWKQDAREEGGAFVAEIESTEKYAGYLEHGTPGGKIAPRPYADRIREKAAPAIQRIYKEPYV
ncbi:HK97 gp10 family phage protein [Lachnospiraceae bacterium 48-42]|jgi:Bacteriophage protein of unknown function (DUF646).